MKSEKLFVAGHNDVCTDIPTDGRTFPPLMLLGRLGGVDIKMIEIHLYSTKCSDWKRPRQSLL